MEITVPLALLAGIVSFASPCFLPIVPAFVGQLVGTTEKVSRPSALVNATSFVVGFSAVFIAMWASIGVLGRVIGPSAGIVRIVGGAILIVMGLHVAGLIEIGLLTRVVRAPVKLARTNAGALRSGLLGLIFGAGWTPCIGPILGGILALATVSGTSAQGVGLMIAYCLGLGLPIVLVAVGAVEVNGRFDWFRRHHVAVSLVSGGFLVLIGFLMITNLLAKLAGLIPIFGL